MAPAVLNGSQQQSQENYAQRQDKCPLGNKGKISNILLWRKFPKDSEIVVVCLLREQKSG